MTLNITALNNAATDLEKISEFMESSSPTMTTRLGSAIPTRAGLAADFPAAAADAAAAAASAGAAASSETAAAASETNAAASEAQAAVYASTAATGAKFFDTIALGRAGVADGATFGVVAAGSDALAWPTLYRREAAGGQTRVAIVLSEDGAETFSAKRVNSRSVTVTGLAPVTGTSQAVSTTQLYRDPLPAGKIAKLEFYIQAIGDGTVDVVLFQRSRATTDLNLTERARLTINVVAGVNTILSSALSSLTVQENDYIGLVRDATGATPGYVTAGGLGVLRFASATPPADSGYLILSAAGANLRVTVVADALEADSLGPTLAAAVTKNSAAIDGTGEQFTLGAPTVSAGDTVFGATGGTFWYEHPVVRRSYLREVNVRADIAGFGEVVVLRRTGTGNSAIITAIRRFPVELAAGLNTFGDTTFKGYILEPSDSVGVTVAGSTMRRDTTQLMEASHFITGTLATETTSTSLLEGAMFNWKVEPLREPPLESKQRTAYDQVDFRTTTAPTKFLSAGGWTAQASGLLSPVGTGAFTQRLTQRAAHRTEQIVARWDAEAQGAGSKIAFGYDTATCVVDGTTGFFVVCNSGATSASLPATYQQQALPVALAAGKKFRVEMISNRRSLTYKYTDLTTGQTLTISEDYSAGTSITPTTGRMRGSAVAINLAGQTRILQFDQMSAQLRPTLAIIGDSITDQTGVLQTAGFPGLLTTSLGAVSVAGIAGNSSDDYTHFINDLVTQRPKAVLSYFGTNDGDTNLSSFTKQKNFLNAVCKAAGIKLGLGVVAPNSTGKTYTSINAYLLALAAEVKKIRFDLALTTGHDGVTMDASLFLDANHPTATGHAAMFSRIQADWPELWDL